MTIKKEDRTNKNKQKPEKSLIGLYLVTKKRVSVFTNITLLTLLKFDQEYFYQIIFRSYIKDKENLKL